MKWDSFRSSEILDIRDGTHDSPKYIDNGYPLITSKNLIKGAINFENVNYINEADYNNINKRSKVDVGDILYSMIGSIGNYAIITEEPNYAVKNVAIFKFKDKRLFNGYFIHLLNAPIITRQIAVSSRGGTQKFVSLKILRNLKIPLPPLPIQKQIAEILDTADALRRETVAQLADLDALAQSVFLEMFGDPAINPKNFKIKSLNKFYITPKEGTKCGPFGSALKKGEYVKKGIAVWVMDNISKKGEFLENDCLWITQNKYEQLSGYNVQNGDIIISRAGTVGKMCVVNTSQEKSIISSNLIRIRLDSKKLLPLYFVSLMVNFSDRVGRLKKGADGSFTHMSTKVLDGLKFPYPPTNIQTQFAQIIQNIESQKSELQQSLQESEDLFNGLLQEVFGKNITTKN